MSDLRKKLHELSLEQKSELYQLLKAQSNKNPIQEIDVQDRTQPSFPLSFMQEALWFLAQFHPDSTSYHCYEALSLRGAIQVRLLNKAADMLLSRHEALRTVFSLKNDQPVQIITDQQSCFFQIIDLTTLSEEESEQEFCHSLLTGSSMQFDLEQGPLLKIELIKKTSEEYILLIGTHHIIIDMWSLDLFVKELFTCYLALLEEKSPSLPPLPVQYIDYACWQRKWLSSKMIQKELTYWREQLAGMQLFLHLPTDHARPPIQTFKGKRYRFSLPLALTTQLVSLAQREEASSFMAFLALFQLFLSRYSGQDDIIVGTPITHRQHVQTEGVVGLFLNTLIIRGDLSSPTLSFRSMLAQVRTVMLYALEHQNLPFEYLVKELLLERNLAYNPLFQVMFVLVSKSLPIFPGLQIQSLEIENQTSKVDLILYLEEVQNKFHGYFEYNSDLFDEETLASMVRHFQRLLEIVVLQPDHPLKRVSLLTLAEQRETFALQKHPPTARIPACLHTLFEAQAQQRPDAIAVLDGNQHITYQALDQRSNQLAFHLRRRGVTVEKNVGLYLDRSWELIIGILGILKAGGAYVPIDVSYPSSRIAFILSDAQIATTITQERFYETLVSIKNIPMCLCIDRDWPDIAKESTTSLIHSHDPASPAYVIYTSGSTGIPKGVLVSHANVTHLMATTHSTFLFNQHDCWTLFHSVAFDFSVWELWGALLYGGRLVIVSYWTSRSAEAFYRLLLEEQVTILNQTPSAFSLLLQGEKGEGIASQPLALRFIIFGGEALNFSLLLSWFERHGDHVPQLVNMYGITETTVHVTYYPLTMQAVSNALGSIIGRPFADFQLYILDSSLNPVPPGVPGEMYVGGTGLARGYLSHPDITAAQFIPHPFGSDGERLYKTGDLARMLRNGDIEYLGRIDHQVKIRGFRVELGEIENVLKQYSGVHSTVVVQREDTPGVKKLIAYISLNQKQDEKSFPHKIQTFLRAHLPEYMLPSAYMILDTFPLTLNGKIDYRRLPPPDALNYMQEESTGAPLTPIEEIIAGVWMQVLPLSKVGSNDNFFSLGGHSLLTTQVISRLRALFHREIPLKYFFTTPTIAGLSQYIEAALQDSQPLHIQIAPEPVPSSDRTKISLSFAQQRLWFLEQFEPRTAIYNALLVFTLQGTLNYSALQFAFKELLDRHEILRTSFAFVDGSPQQFISPLSSLSASPVKIVNLSSLTGSLQAIGKEQLLWETQKHLFDLQQCPLVRFILLQMEEIHMLLICMHHTVFDGVSLDILLQDIAFFYNSFVTQQPPSLPPLPIQYADYALWQQRTFSGEKLETSLTYWKQRLNNAPEALALPADHTRPSMPTFKGELLSFQLSQPLSSSLRKLCRETGVTLFMLLFAAFNVLLFRYTGEEDIVIGSPIANRPYLEMEKLVGLFVNILVLRTDLSGSPTFLSLLERVREMTIEAYVHQDVPFEKLVEILQPTRDLAYHPLFQIVFNVQNDVGLTYEFIDLKVTPEIYDRKMSQFDLSLQVSETTHELKCLVEYSTELFERTTIVRMMKHWQTLLESIVHNPRQSITHLPLLAGDEIRYLLVEANDTVKAYPEEPCLHQFFEQQVQQTPERIALVFEDQCLTYLELDQRANQLAFYLRRTFGIGGEGRVGICMQRSLEAIIAMLGVLKAGGVYIPIDPSYPRERIDYVLRDSNASVLLTQHLLKQDYFSDFQFPVVCMDADHCSFSQEDRTNPALNATSDNLAYMIYTSGSTGHPKGVMISHRSICNHMLWMKEKWPLIETDSVLQRAPFGFDASVWEIYAPLISGARVVLARPNDKGNSEYLINAIVEHSISIFQLTPALLQIFVEAPELGRCKSLKRIYFGGEALAMHLLHRVKAVLDVELYNFYGQTESTVEMSCWQYNPECSRVLAPLGYPISNAQIYLLDTFLQPVPVGVAGEVYVGGVCLSRGYLHLTELTAEKFIPHPFSEKPGQRLYKTGDLARYLADGNLEFLGRADHQIKLHGYRIELGEVEAVLRKHPSLQDAFAMVGSNEVGDKRLIAYIVLATGETLTIQDLRPYLEEKLPDYMIPHSFVILDALPINASGKIDRRMLPTPDWKRSELAEIYVAPQTPIEHTLASIWSEFLNVEKISIYDNFFHLGGHSLLATRLVARLRTIFPVDIPLRSIFDAPTISQFAPLIEAKLIEKVGNLSQEEVGEFLRTWS